MAVLTGAMLDEILEYLERSLAGSVPGLLGGQAPSEAFVAAQFDARLESLLAARGSGTHHLESGMKARVIRRRREIIAAVVRACA